MVPQIEQLVGGQTSVSVVGQSADERGSHAVIAKVDELLGVARLVPELRESADEIVSRPMHAHFDEAIQRRSSVSLGSQLIHERKSDVVKREIELLFIVGPWISAPRELFAKLRIGAEVEDAPAPARADTPVEGERAGVSSQPEPGAGRWPEKLRDRQSLERRERNRE